MRAGLQGEGPRLGGERHVTDMSSCYRPLRPDGCTGRNAPFQSRSGQCLRLMGVKALPQLWGSCTDPRPWGKRYRRLQRALKPVSSKHRRQAAFCTRPV